MGVPLELQLEQATHLKNVLEALSDMFRDASFDFSGTGCEIQALDTTCFALVSLLLRDDAFTPYHCFRDISMGLNLADIAKAFRSANNNDKVIIKAEGDDKLIVTFESENGVISYFRFDAYDIDSVPYQIPEPSESECQATVCMTSAKFMLICKKLSIFVDRDREDWDTVVTVTVDKEGVSFYTRGGNGSSRIFCPPKEPVQIEMKEKVSLMFTLSYIRSFSKASTLSDRVTINLASMKPAVFEYEIARMGYIRYYILPLSTSDYAE